MQDEEMKIMITDTLPATFRSMQAGAARLYHIFAESAMGETKIILTFRSFR